MNFTSVQGLRLRRVNLLFFGVAFKILPPNTRSCRGLGFPQARVFPQDLGCFFIISLDSWPSTCVKLENSLPHISVVPRRRFHTPRTPWGQESRTAKGVPANVHIRVLPMYQLRGPNCVGRPGRYKFTPQTSEAASGTRGLSILQSSIRASELLRKREWVTAHSACVNKT